MNWRREGRGRKQSGGKQKAGLCCRPPGAAWVAGTREESKVPRRWLELTEDWRVKELQVGAPDTGVLQPRSMT